MAKISFQSSLGSALRGRKFVAIFASEGALRRGVWKSVFPERCRGVVKTMLKDADPGPLGKVLSSYTGAESPRRVAVVALPDSMSRHAAPSRSDAIGECCPKLGIGHQERAAIVLCLDDAKHYAAAANAIGRSFSLYSKKSKKKGSGLNLAVVAVDRQGSVIRPPAEVVATVEAARWAASLVDRPTAELSTADFVSEARRGLKGLKGVKVSAIVGADLLKKKLGGLHAVGRAAAVSPRLLVLEYKPRGSKTKVALVGKGVVYDTGGLNLKTGGSMSGMKTDMGGGAATLGAFRALVKGGCPHHLVCLVLLAENAIGPGSYRPDDILTMHSGKTVEINNTDAEGRLLLADGVSYAARVLKADVVIDAATLTGAQLISTGKRHAAVVSNRERLEALAVSAGRASGDLAHPLPFAPEFYQSEFTSAIADMRNSVKDRYNAQSSCAGQFVYSHIQDLNTPWLHIDLAGPAHPGKRASGFGVALLTSIVRGLKPATLKR